MDCWNSGTYLFIFTECVVLLATTVYQYYRYLQITVTMKYNKYKGSEFDFQKALAYYLDTINLLWFHPANEIKAKPQYMAKRKLIGVKSGVPDFCILEPNKKYKGLFIEIKVGYNKPNENQMKWIEELNKRKYYALVSYSLDECIEVINNYIKNKI